MALEVNMDVLAQYHPKHANSAHVSRPDLVQKLAVHALRKIPGAHHVIRKIHTNNMKPVTQVHPTPYDNTGTMQQMLH